MVPHAMIKHKILDNIYKVETSRVLFFMKQLPNMSNFISLWNSNNYIISNLLIERMKRVSKAITNFSFFI